MLSLSLSHTHTHTHTQTTSIKKKNKLKINHLNLQVRYSADVNNSSTDPDDQHQHEHHTRLKTSWTHQPKVNMKSNWRIVMSFISLMVIWCFSLLLHDYRLHTASSVRNTLWITLNYWCQPREQLRISAKAVRLKQKKDQPKMTEDLGLCVLDKCYSQLSLYLLH